MSEEIKGYCIKCKADRVMKDVKITWVADRRVAKGTCPVCGGEMTHFLEKRTHPA